MRLAYKNALLWQLRRQILGFVGFKPSRFTHFSMASHVKSAVLGRWTEQVGKIGASAG